VVGDATVSGNEVNKQGRNGWCVASMKHDDSSMRHHRQLQVRSKLTCNLRQRARTRDCGLGVRVVGGDARLGHKNGGCRWYFGGDACLVHEDRSCGRHINRQSNAAGREDSRGRWEISIEVHG
jgi:hypothetical protein